MKKYKVKITKMPGQINTMAYGGQLGYGLDLGSRKVYDDMSDDPRDSIAKSMTERDEDEFLPDEEYVVMAENNETIVGDFDQDGQLEFQTIKGDSHSDASGGTLLTNKQAVGKSFIFPQTKKMNIKDPELLKRFGVTPAKGGVSPAKISKKFDLSKEKKILDDPNADPLQKKTAEMVKQNKEAKLQELADVVEAMKGYPKGEPNIHGSLATMAYGGYIPMAENGLLVDNGLTRSQKEKQLYGDYPWLKPWTKSNTVKGRTSPKNKNTLYNMDTDQLYNNVSYWEKVANRKFNNMEDLQGYVYSTLEQDPDGNKAIGEMWNMFGHTGKSKSEDIGGFADGYAGGRTAFALNQRMRRPMEQPVLTTRNARPVPFADFKMKDTPTVITPGPKQHPTETTGAQQQPGKTPYTPFHGVQMAQVLNAATRPIKGYFDKPFVPEYVGVNAMYDDPNYNPLLSANATRMDYMNQFGNAQAARSSGSYNPDLMQGIIGETQRARLNNLNTFNTTSQYNNQTYNQNLLNRSSAMKTVRDNNIRTREQMDIARNLRNNDVLKSVGKMIGDRTEMERYNIMFPQFAATGRFWDRIDFTKGKGLGEAGNSGTGSPFMSLSQWIQQNPGMASLYKSGDADKKADIEKQYQQYLRSAQSLFMRNGRNVGANMRDPYTMDMLDGQ